MVLEWRKIKENCFREFKMQYRIVHRKNFFIIGLIKPEGLKVSPNS